MSRYSEIITGGLHVLTDHTAVAEADPPRDLLEAVGMAAAGGTSAIQVRYKGATDEDVYALGRHIQKEIPEVPLIINDKVRVAVELGAEGIHIGQDTDVGWARKQIGDEMLLGVSAYTIEDAKKAVEAGADNIGVLVFQSTTSKPDAGIPVGISGISTMREALPTVPFVAIGGVRQENAQAIMDAGANGVAVIGAVLRTRNPQKAAMGLSQIVGPRR